MMTRELPNQSDFYRRFIMGRGAFDPKSFGVDLDRDAFIDAIVEEFHGVYRGGWTIDELLLHPSEAMRFCSDVRRKHAWYYVPDDIILRSIIIRRKNPGG